MKQWVIAGAVSLGLMCGCAGNRAGIGAQRVVEQIPRERPDWIGKSFWEKDARYFYVGAVGDRTDMALGLREAQAEGEKKLAEQIRQRLMTEFGSALEGQNVDGQTGSYVRDLIAKVSGNVEVSGVRKAESFVEKVEETTGFGVRYLYSCYAQLQLDKQDYMEARRRAMDEMLSKAREAQDAKAEASLEKAFEKLKGGPTVAHHNVP